MEDELIKVIVIGDTMVGKTSFIHRYVNGTYRDEYKSTIGVDFAIKQVRCSDSRRIRLQLWDIAGQERFAYLTRAYYKDARGCILMFDLSRPASFNALRRWKEDLDLKIRSDDGNLLPCLLLANKSDQKRFISQEQIIQACDQLKCIGWMEISVKFGTMVEEAMSFLLDVIMCTSSGRLCKSNNGGIVVATNNGRAAFQPEGFSDSNKPSCPC